MATGIDLPATKPRAEIFERNNELADSLIYLETRLQALINAIDPVLSPFPRDEDNASDSKDTEKPVSSIANVLTAHQTQVARMSDLINWTLERVEL